MNCDVLKIYLTIQIQLLRGQKNLEKVAFIYKNTLKPSDSNETIRILLKLFSEQL